MTDCVWVFLFMTARGCAFHYLKVCSRSHWQQMREEREEALLSVEAVSLFFQIVICILVCCQEACKHTRTHTLPAASWIQMQHWKLSSISSFGVFALNVLAHLCLWSLLHLKAQIQVWRTHTVTYHPPSSFITSTVDFSPIWKTFDF